ncbi:MAG: ABC transporter substrate-binding protein [Candidatus Aenigmarchaeota archaeon]|nr:ABC transporter substrate-binding protein [Candidatus Aenigmarchaeota archaeon]
MNKESNSNFGQRRIPKKVGLAVVVVIVVIACVFVIRNLQKPDSSGLIQVRFRLQWTPQAQFAGYLVAKELGYYKDQGLDVEIRPAGPDLKPQNTVAAGSDDLAVGVANLIVASRSSGVPLKIIAQIFQDSANRYILKKENAIQSLHDLRGKKVGIWMGGDEAEFVAMLKTAGMTLNDVTVVPQGFSVAPFLNGEYVLSMVTTYNELNQIRDQGITDDKLQIIAPGDYDAAIVGDALFTSERYIQENRDVTQKFLNASLKGWIFCAENPEKAIDIVLRFEKSLKREDQVKQLKEVMSLVLSGQAKSKGIGYMDRNYYVTAERVLFDSGQISKRVEPSAVFDDSLWQQVPLSEKLVK